MTIYQAFNESVEYYDDWVKKALPSYDEIFSVAKELTPFAPETRIDVLDLGAGTGLFSKHVLDKDALLTDQLQWLREAGFVNVDCVYKNYFIGVFVATKWK